MEPVTIEMKPRNTINPTVTETTSLLSQVLKGVTHDTYDYKVVSDTYETATGTLTVDGNKTVSVPLVAKPVNYINIAEYGAKFNDPTFDNKPILESAMATLSLQGAGTIFVPDNGDLYTSENIKMKSNIKIIGTAVTRAEGVLPTPKAVIKLMPTVKDFWCIIHTDNEKNITLKNIGIDSNRAERKTRGTLGDLSVLPQIAISTGNTSENITVEDCFIHTNGVWIFSSFTGGIHPKNLKVNNNHIKWTMGYSTPDKPFVEGVTVDNTLVYFDAIGYEFIGNTIETATGYANMTGIEAHGANGVVRNNTVIGVRTGIIPWNMVNKEMNIDNNIVVEDNKFIDVLNGIDIGLTPTNNYVDLQIRRNEIMLNPIAFPGATFSRGIITGVWNAVNGETSEDFVIEDNTIRSRDYEITHKDPAVYYNYYGIGIGSGIYKNLTIRNNTIENMPSFGIVVQNEFEKTLNVVSGLIEGNTIKNIGKSQTNRGSTAVTAIHVASRADTITTGLTVWVNSIIDTRSTTSTWYTKATSMPIADRFKTQEITESKLPPQGEIVYRSVDTTIDFVRNQANIYLESMEVVLQPNTAYILQTDFVGDLWVTNNLNTPTQSKVIGGISTVITTGANGQFGVVARPAKDIENTVYPYNATQLESKEYNFTIRKHV